MRKHIYIFSILILCSLTQSQEACPRHDEITQKPTRFMFATASYAIMHAGFIAGDLNRAFKKALATPIRNGAGEKPIPVHNPNYEQMRAIQNSRNEHARNIYSSLLNPKND